MPLHCPKKTEKRKLKEKNIKSRKINRKVKKNVSVQVHHNNLVVMLNLGLSFLGLLIVFFN